ncbi:nicotinamide mononucleotide transporter [Mycoplasma sp. 2261]
MELSDLIIKKITNIFVALSGFLGVISIYWFAKKKTTAYLTEILNAILYAFFSFTNGLVIDGILQFIYIAILISILINKKIKKNFKISEPRSSLYSSLLFALYFLIFFVIFYFSNPFTNNILGKIFNINYLEFGSNFKYKLVSAILLATLNSISVAASTIMALDFKDS